jgi:hypothetical protein
VPKVRAWIGSCVAAIAILLATAQAYAAGTVQPHWYVTGILQFTLTPNYTSGYGSVPASFGTQATPSPGAGACLQACAVDFGTVEQGTTYLYKYAAHLNVVTNDPNGFYVYGEGAADFNQYSGSGSGNTMPLNGTLYYLPSTASGDTNTGYSSSYPFAVTGGSVSSVSYATAPTITYGTFPTPIINSGVASADLYQDYQMKVPYAATPGVGYYVWIVYTVVPK